MSQDTTVNAGEIARLVDVGRAAVSNWRRRYEDFPQPVGGTASSPLFSLTEVEDWLRRNGKSFRVSPADRVWQQLRASDDDLRLGQVVARAGEMLLALLDRAPVTGDLAGPIAELAAELGHRDAFEALCERYLAAHSRQLAVTAPSIVALLAELVGTRDTVLDPACGLGGLLLAVGGRRVLGQEVSEVSARIASVRMRLAELPDSTILAGDSLREDGFGDELADAVVCDPPFNERSWGYTELTSDPRWVYGLPPRGESELAWVQHCLAHVRPGGLVAILMPSAAAARRPGKRIRGNLLRAGALRAVLTLADGGPDLWLLRRPEAGERPAMRILLGVLDGEFDPIVRGWKRYLGEPEFAEGELFTVPVLDLLDDDVDVSPARHRGLRGGTDVGAEYAAALSGLLSVPPVEPPELAIAADRRVLPTRTVGELIKAGLVTVRHASAKMGLGEGDVPVLTIDDLAAGRLASGRTVDAPDLVRLREGDVVAAPMGLARVMQVDDVVLGPYLSVYRVDPEHLDPDFLAGFLRAADQMSATGSSRIDARRTAVPRLALAEQRHYAAVFRQLIGLQDTVARTAEQASTLVRLGFAGLVDGHLLPKSL
ncbi:MAG TPA: N-6 DNA methylase [Pseudonocardiaceae bacterium]|nr:N-6 DNA methylase [Pseudonocardiaceae bacterium]